jgi:hypothetical protein
LPFWPLSGRHRAKELENVCIRAKKTGACASRIARRVFAATAVRAGLGFRAAGAVANRPGPGVATVLDVALTGFKQNADIFAEGIRRWN